MSPEVLLSLLAKARRELTTDPTTPFLLQSVDRTHSALAYPTLSDGGFSVDKDIHNALQMLVQWGYLTQAESIQGKEFLLTAAGLSYAARRDGTWDGTERRHQDRRMGSRRPLGAEHRRIERRLETVPA
jgi:hypothetical protein